MKKDETVQQMHDRLTRLVTDIKTLGSKDWDDLKVTKKMLRAYAPKNPMLATYIRGKESYKKMKPINLLNPLQFHEMNALDVAKSIAKEEEVKTIALKAEPSKTVESNKKQAKQKKKVDSSDGESTDDELVLMLKNIKRFMKKRNVKKGTSQRRCYKCGEKITS